MAGKAPQFSVDELRALVGEHAPGRRANETVRAQPTLVVGATTSQKEIDDYTIKALEYIVLAWAD